MGELASRCPLCCLVRPVSVYYYFYERSRSIILDSRTGSKALSTLESILAGLIAGTKPHFHEFRLTAADYQRRLRNDHHKQPYLGRPNIPGSSKRRDQPPRPIYVETQKTWGSQNDWEDNLKGWSRRLLERHRSGPCASH
jgi:hypothetical protein